MPPRPSGRSRVAQPSASMVMRKPRSSAGARGRADAHMRHQSCKDDVLVPGGRRDAPCRSVPANALGSSFSITGSSASGATAEHDGAARRAAIEQAARPPAMGDVKDLCAGCCAPAPAGLRLCDRGIGTWQRDGPARYSFCRSIRTRQASPRRGQAEVGAGEFEQGLGVWSSLPVPMAISGSEITSCPSIAPPLPAFVQGYCSQWLRYCRPDRARDIHGA